MKKTITKKAKLEDIEREVDSYRARLDKVGVDNEDGIDVPLHLRGGEWTWNFEKKIPLVDKITWGLTTVNVVIFIALVIKNI